MVKITNPNYRQFLDNGIIDFIEPEHLKDALNNVRSRYTKEGRALIILLYYTGCRPNETLKMLARDIKKDNSFIVAQVPGSKKGLPRAVYLKPDDYTRELYKYASGLFPEMFLFPHFLGKYESTYKNKRGETKPRKDLTYKIRDLIHRAFLKVIPGSISPYFLRHNRFSKLSAAGASMEEIRMIKGARSIESVHYYTHLSKKTARNLAGKIK